MKRKQGLMAIATVVALLGAILAFASAAASAGGSVRTQPKVVAPAGQTTVQKMVVNRPTGTSAPAAAAATPLIVPLKVPKLVPQRNADGSIKAAPPNKDSACPGTEPCDDK